MYAEGAERLYVAAERVEVFRADLAAMADGLEGKKWGTVVHAPIRAMDNHLHSMASRYRDVAGQMRDQGDNVADAHDAHPHVPSDPDVVLA